MLSINWKAEVAELPGIMGMYTPFGCMSRCLKSTRKCFKKKMPGLQPKPLGHQCVLNILQVILMSNEALETQLWKDR